MDTYLLHIGETTQQKDANNKLSLFWTNFAKTKSLITYTWPYGAVSHAACSPETFSNTSSSLLIFARNVFKK
ncbi:hypothetical protein B5X24_HaOG210445 [Helicoverpa armigera]|nr:hypothetical protein B5X24_HaOG210445 [Helicoverpa armigera]